MNPHIGTTKLMFHCYCTATIVSLIVSSGKINGYVLTFLVLAWLNRKTGK